MMENWLPPTSPDGSSNRNPPERCPRPLYSRDSTQEHQEIPQEDQLEDLNIIKVEHDEEPYGRDDDPCKENEVPPEISTDTRESRDTPKNVKAQKDEEGHMGIKEEETLIEVGADGSSNRNTPSPSYSEHSMEEDDISEDNEVN
ncbi:hypothetical protein AB205_0081270 [Aquarana catesbeiana]|uniref:Uncharacterized protein n=1 Tax=Aquarana catesbeiana TaxID=8400 RepID=A0A2G9S065_AQUCT|nr:hypothetical protein AB205_0081270 [Aquarana catesbeiana]PIO33527.1 hypothetical protein AB205_0081270 [Aquarana catesbeiana]